MLPQAQLSFKLTRLVSWKNLKLLPHQQLLQSTSHPKQTTAIRSRKHGQPQENGRIGSSGLKYLKQSLRALNKKWKGPKDCARSVSEAGHPLLIQSVLQLFEDSASRCCWKRYAPDSKASSIHLLTDFHSPPFCALKGASRHQSLSKGPLPGA